MQNIEQGYTILILGKNGVPGNPGSNGDPGVNSEKDGTGQNGTDGSYSWLGGCTAATNGTKGADGIPNSTDGTTAGNGSSPYPFTMHVGTFLFPNGGGMNILSKGGDGGKGGAGGAGGNGATGGNAGNTTGSHESYDKNCIKSGKCPPATGGPGGDGQDSGKGGKGGDAGDGGLITIYYKDGNNINQVVISAPAGDPGDPGDTGAGGIGGTGGMNEIWPPGSDQTYAFPGNTGAELGNYGGGATGNAGTIKLIHVTPRL